MPKPSHVRGNGGQPMNLVNEIWGNRGEDNDIYSDAAASLSGIAEETQDLASRVGYQRVPPVLRGMHGGQEDPSVSPTSSPTSRTESWPDSRFRPRTTHQSVGRISSLSTRPLTASGRASTPSSGTSTRALRQRTTYCRWNKPPRPEPSPLSNWSTKQLPMWKDSPDAHR